MSLSGLDIGLAGGASVVAGAVNAMAGGGTLIAFPALLAIGVPALGANVTTTFSLCPGYFSGALSQREDLVGHGLTVRWLAATGGLGGLAGSALLVVTPSATFKTVVPFLLLLSCLLLALQSRVRSFVRKRSQARAEAEGEHSNGFPGWALVISVFVGGIYGGFFGAGLGIAFLAVLGLFLDTSMITMNAIKQVLSLFVNTLAAVFFAFSGHVHWVLVPAMGAGGLLGGVIGGRLVRVINPEWLRRLVILIGLAVAIDLLITG